MTNDINKIDLGKTKWNFSVIAGPCSAESESQLMKTAEGLHKIGIENLRVGVWKPRTMPGGFEGAGEKAIPWMKKVREVLGMNVYTEVAKAEHVNLLSDEGFDSFWIGARSTVNPFTVEELATSLAKVKNAKVFVKNPINPDLNLWIGAITRLQNAGVEHIGAIHRGFSSYGIKEMRNPPYWQIAMDLKKHFPNITLLADPSHISGKRNLIEIISQTAIDMNYDGLIIESHCDPDNAWTDALQQVRPQELENILNSIDTEHSRKLSIPEQISYLRHDIDDIDEEIIRLIAQRFACTLKLGQEKNRNNMPILQLDRYKSLIKNRLDLANKLGLREELIDQIFGIIHEESVYQQEMDFTKSR